MNKMKLFTLAVLVGFAGLNVFAISEGGLAALEALVKEANPWAILFGVDLTIALAMVTVGLWRDARARGISPLPYVLLTAFTGSIGPLLYVVRREP
jgi:hypothetical protein